MIKRVLEKEDIDLSDNPRAIARIKDAQKKQKLIYQFYNLFVSVYHLFVM
jgi:hypothetical protein